MRRQVESRGPGGRARRRRRAAMATVVKMGGGGSGKPSGPQRPSAPQPSSDGGGTNRMPLLIALITVVVLAVGFALWNVIPHAPPEDRVTATDRERTEDAKLTPEQRKAKEQAGMEATDKESTGDAGSSGR